MRSSLLTVNIDLALINTLRSFKHTNHEFEQGFVETVYAHLFYYQGNQQAELFDEFSLKKEEISLKQLVLSLHFRFAAIYNLDILVKALGNDTTVTPMNVSNYNNTNIMSDKAIMDLGAFLNYELLNQKKNASKPNLFKELTIKIVDENIQSYDKETKTIYLSYNYLALGFIANGKLEPYFTTSAAHILNIALDLKLYHVLFSFLRKKPEEILKIGENYSTSLSKIYKSWSEFKIDKKLYQVYRDKFVDMGKSHTKFNNIELDTLIKEIREQLQSLIIARQPHKQYYIEKLLVGMLGHPIASVRDNAIIFLNVLYDGVDWQLKVPMISQVMQIGQKFRIDYLIESYNDDDIVLILKSFIFQKNTQHNVQSFFKPKVQEYRVIGEKRFVHVSIDFGVFRRCGFYDWRLMRLGTDGILYSIQKVADLDILQSGQASIETKPVQGRFIVQPDQTRDLQIHEVFVDMQDSSIDDSGQYLKRGNFKKVTEKLQDYKDLGINCIYLMGTFERDNGMLMDKFSQQPVFKRPDSSPLAVTSRDTCNFMLGGKKAFKDLIQKAKSLGIKILVDSLTRVSSSRMHNKYRKFLLKTLDVQGKLISVYGTDGRAVYFEDTTILNYRKFKCWDLFLKELLQIQEELGITGIHLDNGQAWPQIFKLDIDEMYRQEPDFTPAYTKKQIFNGEVVEVNENCGYWGSKMKDYFPNPFLYKLSRTLWKSNPEFLIISEVWGNLGGLDSRECSIIQSGAIPRLFKLPSAICQFFGQHLKKDGSIQPTGRKNVNSFKKWYEATRQALPHGSIIIQSTTYHTWPYPALLYKRGTWAAIDLFFFLPDIPMTFIGEIEGKSSKVKATNMFASIKVEEEGKQINQMEAQILEEDEDEKDENLQGIQAIKKFEKKSNKILEIDQLFFDKEDFQVDENQVVEGFGFNLFDRQTLKLSKQRRRSSSYLKISNADESHEELKLINQEGWGFIESLKDIHKHYQHRRKLKASRQFFKKGLFTSLLCEHAFGWHTHVLCFACYTKKQMGIVAINFNDGPVSGTINLKQLAKFFPEADESNVVVQIEVITGSGKQPEYDTFFIGEFIDDKLDIFLVGFQSIVYSVNIYINNPQKQEQAKEQSLKRLIESIHDYKIIYSNDCANRLFKLLKKQNSLQQLANGFGYIYHSFLEGLDLSSLISLNKQLKDDIIIKNKFFAFLQLMNEEKQLVLKQIKEQTNEIKSESSQLDSTQATESQLSVDEKLGLKALPLDLDVDKKIKFIRDFENLVEQNRLGSIVIITPEYGKYTKTGGLGVMTDELSTGLADLGEDVYVITPWYEDKNKKNPKALINDGIKFLINLEIWVANEKQTVGIHYGKVNGVHLYFMHHPLLFPAAFEGEDPVFVMKGVVLYTKCSLEILCHQSVKPAIVVTNDWYCGLIPPYIKEKKFGNYFEQSKVFHIIHNLDETYEGRQYLNPQQGNLCWLYELPEHYLIDDSWKAKIVNPSRSAFFGIDNWATVSHSYKYQILKESPLRFLLQKFENAFSFPNGLKKNERVQMLIDKTGTKNDHMKSKEKLQQKYFGLPQLDDSIPLYGFVGRITEQKGIHLILDSLEDLIRLTNKKIQIILGGMANYKEQYSAVCANKMVDLKNRFPYALWCAPDEFFFDGPLLNSGCDFGLMPSKFEPGGIVQHEFFVASTPVVAMKTGGLQDTVHEYNFTTQKGTGTIFESHTQDQYTKAVLRSIVIFKNKPAYQKIRENSFNAVIDIGDVTRAYAGEFYRMYNKNFMDQDVINDCKSKIQRDFNIMDYKEEDLFPKIQGKVYSSNERMKQQFEKVLDISAVTDAKKIMFRYRPINIFPRSIELVGAFDDWKHKYTLTYDQFSREWKTTLNLRSGDYLYKYLIDETTWVCSDDDAKDTDIYGNVNNVIRV